MRILIGALSFLAAGFAPLSGAVIFSTLGPGDTFSTALRYGADGNASFDAFLFQPTATGVLNTLRVAIGHQTPLGPAEFRLYSGTTTGLGTLLEIFSVTPPSGLPSALVTLQSTAHPTLTAGANYWMGMAEPDAPDGSRTLWAFNNQNFYSSRLISLAGGWMPAFDMQSADAPEPAMGLPVAGGLGILFWIRRRKASGRAPSRC